MMSFGISSIETSGSAAKLLVLFFELKLVIKLDLPHVDVSTYCSKGTACRLT
jgi:hypothetical protein